MTRGAHPHAVAVVVRGITYASLSACARAFGISVQAVFDAVERGETDGIGLGRNWRHDLDRWQTMKAELAADGQSVTLRGRIWSQTFPVAALPDALRFYRGLVAKGAKVKGQPGPQAKHYAPTVAALEQVAAQVAQQDNRQQGAAA